MSKSKGYIYGLLSSSSFGLIPLFSLPLMLSGMSTATILLYRFGFASLMVGMILLLRRQSFAISLKQLSRVFLLGSMYFCTAFLLQLGYHYMASGTATVLHFLYPIFTALIMFIFFRQRLGRLAQMAILMAVVGVGLMSGIDTGSPLSPTGAFVVLTSAVGYALYIIIVNKSGVSEIPPLLLNFYILSIATLYYIGYSIIMGGFRLPMDGYEWSNAILLALIPTVLSNLFLVRAIPIIGSTPTSVMGALEPLTAVLVGIFVFGEPLHPSGLVGIILVLSAVLLLVWSQRLSSSTIDSSAS